MKHVSCPNTPEQNGIIERKHRRIVETGLTMLFYAKFPLFLWVEVFLTAVYLINRFTSSMLKMQTPFFKLFGQHSDYNSLNIFSCRCFSYLNGKNKFSPKTYPCVFIGYSSLHKGYRCYHPASRKNYVSRHVVFNEKTLPYAHMDKQGGNIVDSSHMETYFEFLSKASNSDVSANLDVVGTPSQPSG